MSYTHDESDLNPPQENSTRGSGVQASSDNRCPCCDSPKWCFILSDGKAAICGRTDTPPEGWQRTGTAKDGRGIYAEAGSRGGDQRYKGILPNPSSITLEMQPLADFPQWVDIGGGELQVEYQYPDQETGEPLGKIVRKQYPDRRRVYNGNRDNRDSKECRPHHFQKPHHPDQGFSGWWSDRGKGSRPWPLYREAEVKDALASGICSILIYGTGEQSVESNRSLGLYSFCAQGGEGTGDAQVIDFLKRNTPRVFVITPDEDESGYKAAAKLQDACDRSRVFQGINDPKS